jgi:hypothetical protein
VNLEIARQIAATTSANRAHRLRQKFGVDAYPADVLELGAQAMSVQPSKRSQIDAITGVFERWEKEQPLTPEALKWERKIDAAIASITMPKKFRS